VGLNTHSKGVWHNVVCSDKICEQVFGYFPHSNISPTILRFGKKHFKSIQKNLHVMFSYSSASESTEVPVRNWWITANFWKSNACGIKDSSRIMQLNQVGLTGSCDFPFFCRVVLNIFWLGHWMFDDYSCFVAGAKAWAEESCADEKDMQCPRGWNEFVLFACHFNNKKTDSCF